MNLFPAVTKNHIKFFFKNIVLILIFSCIYFIAFKYLDNSYYFSDKMKEKEISFIDFLFFSICTQTTIGFGNIVPRHNLTKILISLQLLISIALVITSII
jgi:predicted membrane protein